MAHKTTQELINILKSAQKDVLIGRTYQHYKTKGLYKVVNIALQEATGELCVIYHPINTPELLWVRNLVVWNEEVEDESHHRVKR